MVRVCYSEKKQKSNLKKWRPCWVHYWRIREQIRKRNGKCLGSNYWLSQGSVNNLTVGAPRVERGHCEWIGPEGSNQR